MQITRQKKQKTNDFCHFLYPSLAFVSTFNVMYVRRILMSDGHSANANNDALPNGEIIAASLPVVKCMRYVIFEFVIKQI